MIKQNTEDGVGFGNCETSRYTTGEQCFEWWTSDKKQDVVIKDQISLWDI
jgi:hypothetical protein